MLIRIFCFAFICLLVFISDCISAIHLELLGQVILPTGLMHEETEVGGLSGISYVAEEDVYYAISDDRSFRQPARFYRLSIDISSEQLPGFSSKIISVTSIWDGEERLFPAGSVDPEGIAVTKDGNLFISSEGVTNRLISPFVALYGADGKQLKMMSVPKSFLPSAGGGRGVRDNMGLESLTLSADGRFLTTASENALIQDGSQATLTQRSSCRLIVFDTESGKVVNEYIYLTDKVVEAPAVSDAIHVNGLVELLALKGNGNYLALERGYTAGKGFNIRLYHTVIGDPKSTDSPSILSKELVLNFDTLGILLDNLEGMSLGPDLPDGRRSLVMISDNNFSRKQFTQILVFAIKANAIYPTAFQ